MAGADQRTEKATPKRLRKAREQGNFPASREFIASLQFFGVVVILSCWGHNFVSSTKQNMRELLVRAFEDPGGTSGWMDLLRYTLQESFFPLGIAGAGLVALTLFVHMTFTQFGFSAAKLAPDLKRLNSLGKLKDLPAQNLTSLAQAVILMIIMAAAVYSIAQEHLETLLRLPGFSAAAGAAVFGTTIEALLWKLAGILLAFGLIDFFRQRRKYDKSLRMSKQEVTDEHKESEGNPHVKSRLRRLRRELLRRQMMREVPKATVVLVNPTHYAVALRYDFEAMASPVVVAKGKNYLALRIRQMAIENGVTIVENPPLARALYQGAEVGQEIPGEFYRAVAEILAYIYRLTGRRAV